MPHYATFRAELNYQNEITADEITVIFNGTTYTVPKDPNGLYGSEALMDRGTITGDYPFCIARESDTNYVYVNEDVYDNHNPFTIKIMEEAVTTTPCFDKARGYWCEEDVTLLTEESVTTTAQGGYNGGELSYSQFIDAETIRVTFDGVEYDCPRIALSSSQNFYGGFNTATMTPDFSQYPFAISSYSGSESIGGRGNTRDVDPSQNYIISQTAGTHTVKIEIVEETITTTSCFEKAVKSVAGGEVVAHMTEAYDSSTECTTYTLDITDDDVRQIVESGSKLKIIDESNCVYYPVNIWARNATPALRGIQLTAKITIVLQEPVAGTPLMLGAETTDATPRYLKGAICDSTNSSE